MIRNQTSKLNIIKKFDHKIMLNLVKIQYKAV